MSAKLTVSTLLQNHGASLVARLPKGMESDRFQNSVRAAVASNPKLNECIASNPGSFLTECARAATMGLEVGDVFGHFYLVPFKNNRAQTTDTVGIVGYKGLLELARRHPQVAKVIAKPVFEGDTFEYDQGEDELTHPWDWEVDRKDANLKGVYCRAILVHPVTGARESVITMLTRAQCDQIKKTSKGSGRSDSPWNTNYVQMCLKSVIRRAINSGAIPMAAEMQVALRQDEGAEEEKQAEVTVLDDVPGADVESLPMAKVAEAGPEMPDLEDNEKVELADRVARAKKVLGYTKGEMAKFGGSIVSSAKLSKNYEEWTVEEMRAILPELEERAAAKAE